MNTTPTFNEVGVLYSQNNFKEELQMSNSSTSPVQYPLPYKVINGCLYKEVTTKSGITTKKLSNFLPYIVKEVSVDDGAEEKYELRLGGVHSSGRLLPEIDVSGSELGNFNWLIERWGADCVLEPERSIRYAHHSAAEGNASCAQRAQKTRRHGMGFSKPAHTRTAHRAKQRLPAAEGHSAKRRTA